MDPHVLADPSEMSSKERTDELVKAVEQDDLLGVLLVLSYAVGNEVNGSSSLTGRTPLETALMAPLRRLDVRQLIAECLLHHGAEPEQALASVASPFAEVVRVVRDWRSVGSQQAVASYRLTQELTLEEAEEYLTKHGLDVDSLPSPQPQLANVKQEQAEEKPFTIKQEESSRPRRIARHGFDEFASHWLYVGNLPMVWSERHLYDRLDRRGVDVGDVFLNTNTRDSRRPERNAFIGVYSEIDLEEALRILNGREVDGNLLRAERFRDKKTGSAIPEMADSHPERRYVGAKRQSDRPPADRRIGLFLLHLPPAVQQEDIGRFLERSMDARDIREIHIRHAGVGALAFVEIRHKEAARQAILDLDGELLLGQAVRVAWRDLDPQWLDTQLRATAHRPPPPERPVQGANQEPLINNRYMRLAAPPAQKPAKHPQTPSSSRSPPPASPSQPAPSAPPTDLEHDIARLKSVGTSSADIEALQRIWDPLDTLPSTDFSRTISVNASFGFLSRAEAQRALEANEMRQAYPDNPAMQERYEAFLKAQAGESKDWYTVFYAQLAEFNRSSSLFSAKGHEVAVAHSAASTSMQE
ncbi:hypothetical protein JCM10213v2_001952 [Rhodosporidiobolus nylandii]